jgi:hypothetical protein
MMTLKQAREKSQTKTALRIRAELIRNYWFTLTAEERAQYFS